MLLLLNQFQQGRGERGQRGHEGGEERGGKGGRNVQSGKDGGWGRGEERHTSVIWYISICRMFPSNSYQSIEI